MELVIHSALEEICREAARGLHLLSLWPKLVPTLDSRGLALCPNVKRAIWENLVDIPSLKFETCDGVSDKSSEDLVKCTVEECEKMNVKIVAPEGMRKAFLGLYEAEGENSLNDTQRNILERIALAGTNGIAQSELSKELQILPNTLFYHLKILETQPQPLIVRHTSIIRNREQNTSSIVSTNMVYLFRYGKNLGSQQRLEITKGDIPVTDGEVIEHDTDENSSKEIAKEDVHVKDFLPALRDICDKLEKAQGKVLVVSDVKRDLCYRGDSGHRAWRNICNRLKDAGCIEEFCRTINKKEVNCLRLLKSFSPSHFESKHTEQSTNLEGQVTEQVFELPILRQIYDMIDAEGSKGLTNTQVCTRLGLNSKEYHKRYFKQLISRFGVRSQLERHAKTKVYRLWTAGNFNPESATESTSRVDVDFDENSSQPSGK